MKKSIHIITVAFFALFLVSLAAVGMFTTTGCTQPPSARVAQVQTLKAVGHTAEAAVASAGSLFQSGLITAAQLNQVRDLYDNKFQPAYRVAVQAVQSDLSIASPELIALAAQLSALIVQFQSQPHP